MSWGSREGRRCRVCRCLIPAFCRVSQWSQSVLIRNTALFFGMGDGNFKCAPGNPGCFGAVCLKWDPIPPFLHLCCGRVGALQAVGV